MLKPPQHSPHISWYSSVPHQYIPNYIEYVSQKSRTPTKVKNAYIMSEGTAVRSLPISEAKLRPSSQQPRPAFTAKCGYSQLPNDLLFPLVHLHRHLDIHIDSCIVCLIHPGVLRDGRCCSDSIECLQYEIIPDCK